MAKAKKYYSLLSKDMSTDAKWSVQYGSYDRFDCDDERQSTEYDDCLTKVICTNDDQASIDAKVASLNA